MIHPKSEARNRNLLQIKIKFGLEIIRNQMSDIKTIFAIFWCYF